MRLFICFIPEERPHEGEIGVTDSKHENEDVSLQSRTFHGFIVRLVDFFARFYLGTR